MQTAQKHNCKDTKNIRKNYYLLKKILNKKICTRIFLINSDTDFMFYIFYIIII